MYNKTYYNNFKVRRDRVICSLGGMCEACGDTSPGLHLHHEEYHPIESSYPRHGRSMSARVKRVKEAEEHPERFRVLCQRHHTQLEGTRKHNPNFSFDQLIKTVGVIIPIQEAPF